MIGKARQLPNRAIIARGYESITLSSRLFVWILVVLVVTVAGLYAGIWFLMNEMAAPARVADQPASRVPSVGGIFSPPLQPTQQHPTEPWQDLNAMRAANQRIFSQLGWECNPATQLPDVPEDVLRELQQHYRASATQPAPVPGATSQPAGGGQ